ncbi:MAG: hypothetical protein ACMUHY_03380 [Thermoplasmatota archaeon]
MERDYDLVLDEMDVKVRLSGKKVLLDSRSIKVRTASLSRKRKYTTFQVILFMLAVVACGVILYAGLNTAFGSDDDGTPYRELDSTSSIPYRRVLADDPSPLFLSVPSGPGYDLSDSVTWMTGGWDVISIDAPVDEKATLHIMWFGDADDLMTRFISVLWVEIDSEDPFLLEMVDLVKLDGDRTVADRVTIYQRPAGSTMRTGGHRYEIDMDDELLGQARNMQSNQASSSKGCLVSVTFNEGISSGELRVKISLGPDYYHETDQMSLLLGAASVIITLVVIFLVYSRVSKETPCLVLDTDDEEYSLTGDYDDLKEVYLMVSKITIPKMKGAEEQDGSRPGITKGKDLIDGAEAEEIEKDLKRRPGGSGKMIVHQCPECMGTELYYEGGFMTGYKYHCKKCDYVGSFVIEKQVDFDR